MYIEPRFNPHDLYYGTYLMVNGEYVGGSGAPAWKIMRLFGWEPDYDRLDLYSRWERFKDWLWYTYPIGLWISA